MLILPVLLKPGSARDVGITGPVPAALAVTITRQAQQDEATAGSSLPMSSPFWFSFKPSFNASIP